MMAKASSTSANGSGSGSNRSTPPYPGAPKEGDRDKDYRFSAEAGQLALDFFKLLNQTEGEWVGRPFVLDRWQVEFIWCLFGWLRPNGTRRYRKAYLEIPRKNGKSTLGAGITLKLLLADNEAGAQIYGAAENRDQAGIIYRIAASMVYASPALAALVKARKLEVTRSTKTISVPGTNSFYRAISSEAPSAHGINAHGVIFDELHTQPNDELAAVLGTSQGARRQPLTVMMTTAGFDQKSLCGREHDYALKVRDGIIDDPTYLAVIYAADEKDDIQDPKTWQKANPSWQLLGETFRDNMAEQAALAMNMPSFENKFKRLHLNIWTRQDVRWMPMHVWDASAGMVNESELVGRVCYGGLDLASTTDLAAFVLVFPPIGDETTYKVISRFWVPSDNIDQRSHVDRVPYRMWADDGIITATPGAAIDYGFIREEIIKLSHIYHIREIGFDRWGATQIAQELDSEGINVVPVGQGFRDMSAPTKELMRMVLAREFTHGGHPVLRWCADNAVVRMDPAGNYKPDKEKSKERIDGIVAAVMAVDRESRNRAAGEPRISFIG